MKKKVLILITAAIVAAVIYLNFSKEPEITNLPSSNYGVVAFGDSLVEGVGSEIGGGFVTVLSSELGMPIVNLGRSGDTAESALTRVGEVTRRKPAITIVLLGGNDLLRRVPQEQTTQSMERMIGLIQASGSSVFLVGFNAGIFGGNQEKIFKDLSIKYRTAYIPNILDDIFGNRELMSDALHPNDAGYRIMAKRIKPVLEELLQD